MHQGRLQRQTIPMAPICFSRLQHSNVASRGLGPDHTARRGRRIYVLHPLTRTSKTKLQSQSRSSPDGPKLKAVEPKIAETSQLEPIYVAPTTGRFTRTVGLVAMRLIISPANTVTQSIGNAGSELYYYYIGD